MGEDMGHTVTEVKIAFPMSHYILTRAKSTQNVDQAESQNLIYF
jgi:hypothetical protein